MANLFSATIWIFVYSDVVHGFSDDVSLYVKEGVVSADCGILFANCCGDLAYTFYVLCREFGENIRKLLKGHEGVFIYKGIGEALADEHLGYISFAVQTYCESRGYGIGHNMHEELRWKG